MFFIKRDFKHTALKHFVLFFSVVLFLFSPLFLTACGKKGPPSLKSYEKPDAPSLLRAIHRENSIILIWNFPSFLKNNKRSYVDSDFKEGVTYSYKIITQNLTGTHSSDSYIITATPLNTPQPPLHITFKIEEDSVILLWKKQQNDLLFNVYKSYKRNTYGLDPINKTPVTGTLFKDVFDISKPVYYTIRSQTKNQIRDEGVSSEEIVVNPFELIPSTPKDLQFFAATDMVSLYWKEPEDIWVTGYRIYRRLENMDYVMIGETQIPSFIDKYKPTTKRDYRVTAVGPALEGSAAEIKGVVFIPEK
jgi:fibronectin type 3 domain-containing protein/predicted small lipoprotein YifL